MGLYGDMPADEIPAYTKSEVALYLRLAESTVSAWARGTTKTIHDGRKIPSCPAIVPAKPNLLGGPCIVGTRITADLVFARPAVGQPVDDIAWDIQ